MRILVVFCIIANLIIIGIHAKKDCQTRLQRCESKKPSHQKVVCGTDNQTYPNRCILLRVQCSENSNLEVKHEGKCREDQPCWLHLGDKRNKRKSNKDYSPECLADGTYAPVQCHMGFCWCSTANGKMIPGTSTPKTEKINCPKRGKLPLEDNKNSSKSGGDRTNRSLFTKNLVGIFLSEYKREIVRGSESSVTGNENTTNLNSKAIEWKFSTLDKNQDGVLNKSEYKELRAMVRRSVKPKKFARKFIRVCDIDHDSLITKGEWINCFDSKNIEENEEKTSHDADSSEETYQDSEEDEEVLSHALESALPLQEPTTEQEKEAKVMDCFADRKVLLEEQKLGNQMGYLPECTPDGRYKKIQCFPSTGYCWCVMEDSGKPVPGTTLLREMPKCDDIQHVSPPMMGCPDHKKVVFVKSLIDFFHENTSSANTNKRELPLKDSDDGHEMIAARGFHSLDSNKNEVLDKKEWKAFRSMVSTVNKPLKKCGRKFLRYCDSNHDRKVTLNEWLQCISVSKINTQGNHSIPPNGKRRGPNPLEAILKAED